MKRLLALAICLLCVVPTVVFAQGAYPTKDNLRLPGRLIACPEHF